MARPFLTARWESLLLLNYRCPGELLGALVPRGTELDEWHGFPVVSLVGFQFLETRVRGMRIPGHGSFEEVNLRFYVRREGPEGVRRGVVFIRELVPHALMAAAARILYNEQYRTARMSHAVDLLDSSGGTVRYSWRHGGSRHSIEATVSGAAQALEGGSEAEFITEHYWGYTTQRDGDTLEYRVEHPPWLVWSCDSATYTGATPSSLYPHAIAEMLAAEPISAFVATGSAVSVHRGTRLGTA